MAAGLMVLGLGWVKDAQAANPDTMRMTVSVNPASVNYSVTITSPQVQGYDFGQVNIGATTTSTEPIVVTNSGNIAAFYSIGVQDITAGGVDWTNNGASLSAATTSYYIQARLVDTGAGQPVESGFNGATYNAPETAPAAADGLFAQGSGAANKNAPGSAKDLWLRLSMPTGVIETGVHTLVMSINAQNN
jgi:hypothetical protein